MFNGLSIAYVEPMNGLLEQTKTAAPNFRIVTNFVAIVYLRMGKLTHLPKSPFTPAVSREVGGTLRKDGRQVRYKSA